MQHGVGNAVLAVSLFLAATGCAGANGRQRTAYERACRSPEMTPAAAREACWCWQQVGAKSYTEWNAYEQAARSRDINATASRVALRK